MSVVPYYKVEEVYVGDTAPAIEFLFLEENESDPRNLTGFAAWVTFWHPQAAPHVVRAAAVGGSNGLIKYELQGDEYDAPGEVLVTVTVENPDFGGTSTGAGFFEASFQVVRRMVRRMPT